MEVELRRSYPADLIINGRRIFEIKIDPHYEKKHSGSVNDDIIVALVKLLDGRPHIFVSSKAGFQYFTDDSLVLDRQRYRLVWLLENEKNYVGVVNAFRRRL